MTELYSSMGLTNDVYNNRIIFSVLILKVRLMRPSLLFAFAAILAICFEKVSAYTLSSICSKLIFPNLKVINLRNLIFNLENTNTFVLVIFAFKSLASQYIFNMSKLFCRPDSLYRGDVRR